MFSSTTLVQRFPLAQFGYFFNVEDGVWVMDPEGLDLPEVSAARECSDSTIVPASLTRKETARTPAVPKGNALSGFARCFWSLPTCQPGRPLRN